jgi:hypothetical protein
LESKYRYNFSKNTLFRILSAQVSMIAFIAEHFSL